MASKSLYELHHHFPRLAEESGFGFNIHRPRVRIDWNKFRLIDIENLIREKRFSLIEQHINDILQCALESEFDVRILDEGVVKMFRLAQLTIEYQQFCRHYLDRSVFVLKEEITGLAQELDVTKKELREKDDEIRKLKRKTKHSYRPPLPYGNDNIATMILKTLANKSDIFPTSNGDQLQYNKCSYCDKVFLNQLYLQSHLSRRHPNVVEIPQRDVTDNVQQKTDHESSKLKEEIMELKSKLKEMENLITKAHDQTNTPETKLQSPEPKIETPGKQNSTILMKDAEVSTNNEVSLLDKIEEWKKEEHEKYNKEINLLRTQILETINSIKDKEIQPQQNNANTNLIEQLHATIKEQGAEIALLKNELANSKLQSQNEETVRKQEAEAQMSLWTKRAEAQAKQYETLLQKLNDVAQEARESRTVAEAERERAAQLQALLRQNMNNQAALNTENPTNNKTKDKSKVPNTEIPITKKPKKSHRKLHPAADRSTLESLHRKAQELLNIKSSLSSSDVSSTSVEKQTNPVPEKVVETASESVSKIQNGYKVGKDIQHRNKNLKPAAKSINKVPENIPERKQKRNKSTFQNQPSKLRNGPIVVPTSPIKLVRSRLTEEVNSRLVSAGIDPLKNQMPEQVFQKQRMQLQQLQELKSKKNPEYLKTRHSILAFLDSSIVSKKREVSQDDTSPSKLTKPFSFTNVMSNVKNKALSLVKSNDIGNKMNRKKLNAEVARKAMSLLKTPPDSINTSPAIQRKVIDSKAADNRSAKLNIVNTKPNDPINIKDKKMQSLRNKGNGTTSEDEDGSNESDHKYYNSVITQQSTKSIESLIKSPARRPSSASADYNGSIRKYLVDAAPNIVRTQSEGNVSEYKEQTRVKRSLQTHDNNSSDGIESLIDIAMQKVPSKDDMKDVPKHTKGVLKNASSISSLSKKKVLFDMDAIQMKSVSASPSQSTEKSDKNEIFEQSEKFELGLVNLDGEEWDISSIENEPLKNDTKIQVNTRTSPKIAELKQTIESQLARRNETSTALVGGVNLMPTPMARTSSVGGSNTSLGSSILDESEIVMPPVINHKAFVKPKRLADKDDSDIDISEYSLDGHTNRKGEDSF